jgi:hypothetical protein
MSVDVIQTADTAEFTRIIPKTKIARAGQPGRRVNGSVGETSDQMRSADFALREEVCQPDAELGFKRGPAGWEPLSA